MDLAGHSTFTSNKLNPQLEPIDQSNVIRNSVLLNRLGILGVFVIKQEGIGR
jgi:hypothetical protein